MISMAVTKVKFTSVSFLLNFSNVCTSTCFLSGNKNVFICYYRALFFSCKLKIHKSENTFPALPQPVSDLRCNLMALFKYVKINCSSVWLSRLYISGKSDLEGRNGHDAFT